MPEASIGSGAFGTIETDLTTLIADLQDLQSPATILNGQVTLTGTPTRDALVAVATPIKSVTVTNLNSNAIAYIGNATVTIANGDFIAPGASKSLDIDDLNKVNVIGTAGNVLSYLAVN